MAVKAAIYEFGHFLTEPSQERRLLIGGIATAAAVLAGIASAGNWQAIPTGPVLPGSQQAPLEHIQELPAPALQNGKALQL